MNYVLCPCFCDTYHFQCILMRLDLTLPLQEICRLVIAEYGEDIYHSSNRLWRQHFLKSIVHTAVIARKMYNASRS